MSKKEELPVTLTIAGSDSGGGSGIQADLKTFSALQTYGTSAITCITAQSPDKFVTIQPVDPELIAEQINAVCNAFPVRAAKTGVLYNVETIEMVAAEDIREGIPILVVDPVMVSSTGDRMLQADAVEAMCKKLLPQARLITPNLHEAEILCGHAISSIDELRQAAREIGTKYDVACIVKGGHLKGEESVDVLYDEGEEHVYAAPRIDVYETHGAGCCFSAAVTAYLAQKELMSEAVRKAKDFVWRALQEARPTGRHYPLYFDWNTRLSE